MIHCPFLQNAFAWLNALKSDVIKKKSLGYVLMLAVIVALLFGLAVFIIDPNVHSLWDGIWYAWVTMTHVGYGDVVPVSFLGRLLSSLLIVCGLALLALLTAIMSSILIGQHLDEVGLETIRVEKEASPSEPQESEILAELKRLHERLDQIEQRLKSRE